MSVDHMQQHILMQTDNAEAAASWFGKNLSLKQGGNSGSFIKSTVLVFCRGISI
ncbi:MAG: hypothetical protein OSB67_08590 [Alphaproteobacteria bacterium]|jgi:hypothetical protein|nr:hypothetical protein [Alphaproteobacteria bacterium]